MTGSGILVVRVGLIFFENKSAKKITKANIGDGSVFGRRFDGLFHSIIEASAKYEMPILLLHLEAQL